MELDEQQAKAVKTVSPKAMVLAGAGSGKTRVLTERIYHLVKDQNVSLFDIMAFSFTRRASNEIRTRLEDRIGPVIHRAYLGTMHSIALSFLRRFGRSIGLKMANITVYSEWESSYLLRDVAMAMGVLKRNKWNPGKTKIKEVFDLYYSTGIEPLETSDVYPIWRNYFKRCRENNALTYGGLLIGMRLLIPELAKHLHIKHILVDEVQDIDPLQWFIIECMVKEFGASLFIVGDIDQSVYAWRGAVPEYLIDREREYDVFRIENNYRSAEPIVDTANRLISHNEERIDKIMRATRVLPPEEVVTIVRGVDSEGVIQLAGTVSGKYENRSDLAILCRIHAPLQKMAEILTEHDIPHTYIGKKSALVNSEEFRRYHAFFKIMVNPYDNFAFLLTKDHLYISDSVYDQIRVKAEDEGTSHYLAYCKMFGKEVLQGSEWTLAKAILWLAEELRIEEEVETPVMNEITTFMLNWIKKDTDGTVLEYLNWLATFDIQDEMDEDHMGIQLMTIHAAKGLEWPSVIVAGCNEGILPSSQAIKADSLEDERRLAYVAWTRAEDQLILTVRPESTHGRGRYGKSPISRFIQESM